MALIPPIGAVGTFKVSAPFTTKVDSLAQYECKAVRRFIDIIHQGVDPYSEYYLPLAINEAKYNQDYKSGACIVTLVSTSGNWVHVPTTYIESYPILGGVPYTAIVLGINLGAIPDYLDLSALKSAMVGLVRDYIGINSEVKVAKVSNTQSLTYSDHETIEAARQLQISTTATDYSKLLAAQAQVVTLQQQLTALQNYIKDNLPP